MTHHPRRSLRLVTEFLVISVGVAMGLFAEDFRQNREDQARAVAILGQIHEDLESDSDQLEILARLDAQWGSGAHELLRFSSRPAPPPDSVLAAARSLLGYFPFQPSNTGYVNLKEGGHLSLLEDPEARAAIIQYYEPDQTLIGAAWRDLLRARQQFSVSSAPHIRFLVDDSTSAFPPIPPQEFVSSASAFTADPQVTWAAGEQGAHAGQFREVLRGVQSRNAELRSLIVEVIGGR